MSFVETMQTLEAIARGTDKDVAAAPAAVAEKIDALTFSNGNEFSTKLQAQTLEEELKAIGQMTNIDPRIRAAALRAEQRIEGELQEKKVEGLIPDDNAKPQIAAKDQDDDAPAVQPATPKKSMLLAASTVLVARNRREDFNEGTVSRLIATATRSPDLDVQRSAMSSLEAASAARFDFSPKQVALLTALAFETEIKDRAPEVREKAAALVSAVPSAHHPEPGGYGQRRKPPADERA